MTELLVSRGDTFPRSFLDTYRNNKPPREPDQFYNDLKSSKSDELILQNSADIPTVSNTIYHGCSENVLDNTGSPPFAKGNFLKRVDITTLPEQRRQQLPLYDKVDPEDSIRDIVTENDFYRFVLFKKHYDKYLHLSQKYEEAKNIAYYLEEKYHEVKLERDDLIRQKKKLAKQLESNEFLLREKEDESFVQLERVLFLEEQCDKLKGERDKLNLQKLQIEKERDDILKVLNQQAQESEMNRRKLELARQEAISHMTKIKNEKEYLELENDRLKEVLQSERKNIKKYINTLHIQSNTDNVNYFDKEKDNLHTIAYHTATLSSQFQKAMRHLATCKRRKCSVCSYTKAAFGIQHNPKYNHKLLSCLQTPFLEVRNLLKPPPSPICNEGESLSEFFRPLTSFEHSPSECSSLSIPFAELGISFMDDTSESSISHCEEFEDKYDDEQSNTSPTTANARRFGSDSGFASDFCPEYNLVTSKEKFSPKATLDESECVKLTRSKWTASFRKFINRIKK